MRGYFYSCPIVRPIINDMAKNAVIKEETIGIYFLAMPRIIEIGIIINNNALSSKMATSVRE